MHALSGMWVALYVMCFILYITCQFAMLHTVSEHLFTTAAVTALLKETASHSDHKSDHHTAGRLGSTNKKFS